MSIYRLYSRVICGKTVSYIGYGTPLEGAGEPEGVHPHPHIPYHDDAFRDPLTVKYAPHL